MYITLSALTDASGMETDLCVYNLEGLSHGMSINENPPAEITKIKTALSVIVLVVRHCFDESFYSPVCIYLS